MRKISNRMQDILSLYKSKGIKNPMNLQQKYADYQEANTPEFASMKLLLQISIGNRIEGLHFEI